MYNLIRKAFVSPTTLYKKKGGIFLNNAHKTIDAYFTNEIIIDKSRFITHLAPTDSAEIAKNFIEEIKKKYHDATHNCSAYIISHDGNLLQKSNDDGEPSGTAGMPMLQALIQRDMTNITAVVTRYFGGIKLGAGGLIRAYSGAVLEALNLAPLMTYTAFDKIRFQITYDELNKLYYLQELTQQFTILETVYDTHITAILSLKTDDKEMIQKKFTEQLLRTVTFEQIETEIRKTPYCCEK